jgi:hypothetical protein
MTTDTTRSNSAAGSRPPAGRSRRSLRLRTTLTVLALVVAACGGGGDDPSRQTAPAPVDDAEPSSPSAEQTEPDESLPVDGEFETGRNAEVHLSPAADEAGIEEVESLIEGVLADSDLVAFVDRIEAYMDTTFEPGLFDDHPELLPCFRYGGATGFFIQLEQPDPALLQSIADALRDHPDVLSVESFGLDLGFSQIPEGYANDDEGRELGYDEYLAEACSGFELLIDLDSSLSEGDRDALAAEALALDIVGAVMVERSYIGDDEFFVPDLSAYPAMSECFESGVSSIRVVLRSDDRAATEAVIRAFEGDPRVAGFFGRYVDEQYFVEEFDEEAFLICERMTAHVALAIDISDADAAVVVARALGIPGVADVELELFDPELPDDCDVGEPGVGDDFGEGGEDFEAMAPGSAGGSLQATISARTAWLAAFSEVIDSCFVPDTSSLRIYRGDPDMANQRVLAEALCDLPGVISIGSFDTELSDADPYLDCMALFVEIRMEASASDADRDAVQAVVEASGLALSIESAHELFEDGYVPRVPKVVAGDIDPYLCDPELAWEAGNMIGVRLTKVDEAAATALAERIAGLAGVADVSGNAVRSREDIESRCGRDLIWFWLAPDSTQAQREAVYSMLGARADVVAVVVIDEGADGHVHDGDVVEPSRWAGVVKFRTEDEPADIERLIEQLETMPGVVRAERVYHEDEFFECIEGDACDGGDTP